jgi:hypothetical protein
MITPNTDIAALLTYLHSTTGKPLSELADTYIQALRIADSCAPKTGVQQVKSLVLSTLGTTNLHAGRTIEEAYDYFVKELTQD